MYNFDKSFIMDIPKELLSKEFVSQFKNADDVDGFLRDLHSRLYEQMLEGELDAHLGYDKHSAVIIVVIPVTVNIPRRFRLNTVSL